MSHPHTKDWSEICVPADQCVGTTRRAVLKLDQTFTEETDKLVEIGSKDIQPILNVKFDLRCAFTFCFDSLCV